MRLVREMVWENFVEKRRGWEYFSYLVGLDHPACCLIRQYRHRWLPVVRGALWIFWDSGGQRDRGG